MNFKLLLLLALCQTTLCVTTTEVVPETEPTGETAPATAGTGATDATEGTAGTGGTGATTDANTGPTTTGPTTTGKTTTKAGVTTASGCKDKSADCAKKTSLCKKTGYVDFMKDLCPASCGYCGGNTACVDTRTQCAAWNQHGYCLNRYYTTASKKEACAKTCNLCTAAPTKPCADVDTRCAAWAKNNFCTNTFYAAADKKAKCAKTCNMC